LHFLLHKVTKKKKKKEEKSKRKISHYYLLLTTTGNRGRVGEKFVCMELKEFESLTKWSEKRGGLSHNKT